MDIFIHKSAESFLQALEQSSQKVLHEHLKALSEDPYSNRLDIKKLKGIAKKPDLFRMRVGDFRIVYSISEGAVWITEIMRREKGYDF